MRLLDRITSDSLICSGQPTIRDTRIPVDVILPFIEAEMPYSEILDEWFPELEAEDLDACREFLGKARSLDIAQESIKLSGSRTLVFSNEMMIKPSPSHT